MEEGNIANVYKHILHRMFFCQNSLVILRERREIQQEVFTILFM